MSESDQKTSEGTAYPLFALESVLRIAETIKDLGGVNGDVRREVLASELKLGDKSPSFSQRIGAARAHGLIEGKGAYRLSERAKRYCLPTNETDKAQALLEIFAAPGLYGQLIKRFDGGKLPSQESLTNLLHREFKIGESWTERVARFFIRSAQYAGALDGQGFLRYSAARHDRREPSNMNPQYSPAQNAQTIVLPANGHPEATAVNTFRDAGSGASVRVEVFGELPIALWEKLHGYVQILKPPGQREDTK
jgi:hypothetical protein